MKGSENSTSRMLSIMPGHKKLPNTPSPVANSVENGHEEKRLAYSPKPTLTLDAMQELLNTSTKKHTPME